MIWNCTSQKKGGPSIPTHRARSRSGRSVAASCASKPVRYEVDDCIKRNPNSRDPIPVARSHAHIESVSHVESLQPDPQSHQKTFGRSRDQMQQVHTENGPDDSSIGVVVPAELQSAELDKTQRDRYKPNQNHCGHADADGAQIHSQTSAIDHEHRHTTCDQHEQVCRGEAEVWVGLIKTSI